jgi:hypothetical protein
MITLSGMPPFINYNVYQKWVADRLFHDGDQSVAHIIASDP